jgi:peptide/nickel transport system substrate-binding protein
MKPAARTLSITLAFLSLAACSREHNVGGTIAISSSGDADILFPPLTMTLQGKQVVDQVFDNLADIGPSLNTVGDAGFTPRLADSWRWAPDSLSVAFHINPAARWHDGKPVTASDVHYTFQLVKDTSLASPLSANLDNVDSVSVAD